MSKTYVALFDKHKRIVMLVHWGDAWVDTTKGWFNVYFYPQDSSTGSQSSGYLYTSFKKTGKLWWGPYQGGEGAVYASIDGSGSSYPIAECDNASRVIKYVVILGYRYYSYSLVSMRIHDIAVVADLNRHAPQAPNPDEPVVYDGTSFGITESNEAKAFVTQYEGVAADALTMVWLVPWPALEFTCNLVVDALEFYLVFTVDILGALTPVSCSFVHPDFEAMSVEEQNAVVAKVMGLSTVQFLQGIIVASALTASFFATFQLLPGAQAAYTLAMLTWTFASLALIYTIADYYLNRKLTKTDAAWSLAVLLIGFATAGVQLSEQGLLGKVLSIFKKYRGGPLQEWGFHTTFFWCARLLVLLLAIAVVGGILLSPF